MNVPSGSISATNEKPLPHCLSESIDEPLKPTDADNESAVCLLTLAEASQCDDPGTSGSRYMKLMPTLPPHWPTNDANEGGTGSTAEGTTGEGATAEG